MTPQQFLLLLGCAMLGMAFAKKRGVKMTIENKERNKKTIFRFIQGAVVGSIVTIIIFYGLNHKEHERMHELLKKHGIEEHGH